MLKFFKKIANPELTIENYKSNASFEALPYHEKEFLRRLIEWYKINPFKKSFTPEEQHKINIHRESHIKNSYSAKDYLPQYAPTASTEYKPPYCDYEIKGYDVAGVKYNNDDGISRQVILERIYKKMSPFDKDTNDITLEKYKYKNEDAVYVKVDGCVVGNIARPDLPFLLKNFAIHEIHGAMFMPQRDDSKGFTINVRYKKIDISPLSLQETLLQETAERMKEMNNSKAYTRKKPHSRKKYD